MLKNTGTLTLPSLTAVCLWHNEVMGQLSDGCWENSSPFNHWQFWNNLEVVVGEKASYTSADGRYTHPCRKTSYNIVGLMNQKWSSEDHDDGYILRGRMLAMCKMALAGVAPESNECRIGEHMPKTFEEFSALKARPDSDHFTYAEERARSVATETAERFYTVSYTEKDLRKDLRTIQDAMKLCKQ